MSDLSVIHSTFVIERTFPVKAERVFAAFSDPAKKRRWFAEDDDHQLEEFEMNFRVGGAERSRFRLKTDDPTKAAVITNNTTFQDIVPDRRVVIASTMAFGEKPFSASQSTFEFVPTEKGTNLIFTEQAAFFEGSDGPKLREAGWVQLLDQLAKELAQ